MFHRTFIAVDQQISGVEVFNNVFQLLDHGVRSSDDDHSGLLLVLIRQGVAHVAGEDTGRAAAFHLEGLPGLVAGRIDMLSWSALPVPLSPDEVTTNLLCLLLGVRHQHLE